MPIFRVYLLNPAGRIMAALEVEAECADAAYDHAAAGAHPHGIEVWRGAERLLRGGPDADADEAGA